MSSDSDGIAVPLKVKRDTIGVLLIQSYIKGIGYQIEDIKVLEFVAQHIATALIRARAIEETRQRNAELQIINSVQEGLVAQLDIQTIYNLVGNQVQETFNAQSVLIGIKNEETKIIILPYTYEKGEIIHGFSFSYGEPPYSVIFEEFFHGPEPFLVDENTKEWMDKYGIAPMDGTEVPKTMVFVPLRLGGKDWGGYISLQDMDHEHAYSPSDIRLLQTLANSMSVALDNAHLFDETQRLLKVTEDRAAELAVINSIQGALAAKLDIQSIYDAVGDKVSEIFPNADVGIRILDSQTKLVHFPYSVERGKQLQLPSMPLEEEVISQYVLKTRLPLLVNENLAQETPVLKPGRNAAMGTVSAPSFTLLLTRDTILL